MSKVCLASNKKTSTKLATSSRFSQFSSKPSNSRQIKLISKIAIFFDTFSERVKFFEFLNMRNTTVFVA